MGGGGGGGEGQILARFSSPCSTMQSVIGPIRISHLYQTFFFLF